MRAVIQRISEGKVTVGGQITGEIQKGLLVYLGVGHEDTIDDIKYMVEKITNLRIFEDENDKMNLSLIDVGGKLLVVSQFTLMGDCRKGRRPSFIEAGRPEEAEKLYEMFVDYCRNQGIEVATGVFQTHMMVHAINDGPVTMLIDSKKTF
ncbi:D-aminoacyl-tRNA deacylase [Clostridium formicaceticum]|uniref:D-aminoacyl-tRNA deacylase n=1 Tax=Clostridium formicaceticum TaxID=1497 RepID=A0AAC9WG49_9CLOT|nr:D-aminoacyl-tRNA deacylase [Clostridium formicaceticum]AOY76951.1 D-tyrosyl-tRNA(Tyr) deacylase [Clostridium formicaceticum]ARE87434.1 D-tyrosyl-tRNA(Tyr) deacylase [Clostridium formicaceticum]